MRVEIIAGVFSEKTNAVDSEPEKSCTLPQPIPDPMLSFSP
jgi:hypothetical protein